MTSVEPLRSTLRGIEATLADGGTVTLDEVRWLALTLREVLGPDPEVLDPTPEELAAEFGLGPTPSPDMLDYLAEFVRDRREQEAREASDEP